MGPDVCHKLTNLCADITDTTLDDEGANSILTVNAFRSIQCNVAMQVTQPGGQIYSLCMWQF